MRKNKNVLEITLVTIITILIANKLIITYSMIFMIIFSSSFVLYKYIFDKYFSKLYVCFVLLIIIIFYLNTVNIVNGRCLILENNLNINSEYHAKIFNVKEGKNSFKIYLYLEDYKQFAISYLKKNKDDYAIINNKAIYPGNKVLIKGILNVPSSATNEGQFDEKKYLLSQKIKYKLIITEYKIISEKVSLLGYISILNNKLCDIYEDMFSEKNASILNALLWGKSSLIDDDIKKLYTDGGVVHILAISGMHVSIISGIILLILKKLKIKPKISYTISSIFLIFYMVLTGLSLSVIRAVTMNVIFNTSQILNRKYDDLNSIYIAGLIILFFNPMNLFNVGFILSFTSTLALKMSSRINISLPFINNETFKNIFLFLIISPIIAYNFFEFQSLSILANLFIVPFTNILMILSLLLLVTFNFSQSLTILITKTIVLILDYYENILECIKNIEISKIVTGKFDMLSIILYYFLFFLLIKLLREKYDFKYIIEKETLDDDYLINKIKNNKIKNFYNLIKQSQKIKITLLLIISLLFGISLIKLPKVKADFLDVGHGDCIVINTKSRKTVIIDGGGEKSNESKDTGTYIVYPYLKYNGIKTIDLAIVTHPDNDHIKGIIELTELVKIKKILLPKGSIEENDKYKQLIKICINKGIEYEKVSANYEITIDDVEFKCLFPFEDNDKNKFNTNNYSLVFLIIYKNKKILATGDIEKEAEKEILNRLSEEKYDFRYVDFMKAPHHGSDTSSTQEFVDYIKPQNLIVTGNKNNQKKFNQKVIWRYKKNNTKIFYTCNGMLTLNLN